MGRGKHTYKVREDWARVPQGVEMKPAAVAVGPAQPEAGAATRQLDAERLPDPSRCPRDNGSRAALDPHAVILS